MIDHKQQNVEYINCFGSILTNDAIWTREIKSGDVMAEAASNNKKTVYISKLYLILRKKVRKCYMRSTGGKVLELGRFGK
jgi:hypothetical protein